jgi:hypothetical protein
VLLALSWLAPPHAVASSLRSDVLYVLPGRSGQVGFIDLRTLRASPHYDLVKQRFLPPRFAHFERFIRSVGVDADTDLEWVAWALLPPSPDNPGELFLGLAEGQFAPEAVESYFRQQKLPIDDAHGQALFPFGRGGEHSLYFMFLDSSTAAFGTRKGLELLLATRLGEQESLLRNESLFGRISEVNGRQPIWVVLDDHYTRLAVRQLLPEVARFEQFTQAAQNFRGASLQLEMGRDWTLSFQLWCAEPADAQVMSLLLQTGLAVQSWQVREKNAALGSVLSRAKVSSVGDRLELEAEVEERDLQALLERKRLP